MRHLVILPTYNEAENVERVARAVRAQRPALELVVVDDGSPDGTADLVERLQRHDRCVHLVRRKGKQGLGSAYCAGFHWGLERGFDTLITMDCDLSHDPHELPQLLDAIKSCDLVIGSRYVPGGHIANWPLHRRALSRFANFYTRALLRLPVKDCTSGYRAYRREVIEQVDPFGIAASGYSFLEEMVWRIHCARFRIREIPIVFVDRRAGASKIDRSEIFRAAWHVLRTALRSRGR
ncbi:MAG: polyprenol monophosphomannose synthase [Myxococcota bacterium]